LVPPLSHQQVAKAIGGILPNIDKLHEKAMFSNEKIQLGFNIVPGLRWHFENAVSVSL